MAEELEDYWDDIRATSPLRIVKNDLDGQLQLAAEKAAFDLAREFDEHAGKTLTGELFGKMVAMGVRQFMKHWREGLKSHDLAGLIEIVLEGQDLSPDELQGFVQALPASLLKRVAASAVGTANGLHGLMGVEVARRDGDVIAWSFVKDSTRRDTLKVRFTDKRERVMDFFLDDPFELDD